MAHSMVTSARSHATEADLLRMPNDGRKYELVDGQIRVSPAGARHGLIIVKLTGRLQAFVERARLGYVFDSSTGIRLPKGNVRSPDISFVARGRFKKGVVPRGFIPFAPDLAVEVLSPEDRSRFVLDKVGEYLDAGVRMVWVLDPEARSASIYRSLTAVRTLSEKDALSGEDVLPGFRCRLREIL
jgi:Uma2 family endonuclease